MKTIKVTRTNNNSLIVGETEEKKNGVKITNPFAMIPMEEGIRMIPLDIDLIGSKIEEVFVQTENVFYSVEPSEVIVEEYNKLKDFGPEGPEGLEMPETPDMPKPPKPPKQ